LWDVFAEVIGEAGKEMTTEEVELFVHGMMSSRREEAVNEFLGGAEYSDSDQAFESLFLAMGHLVFKKVGMKGDHNALTREVLERFWLMDNWAIYGDVIDAIERLRAGDIRIGILSNATSALVGFLEEIELRRHFDFAIVSAIEGIKKPDRRIFERGLERAGVSASDAAHVGDMYLEDILGARNAGIRPFLIDRGVHSLFPNYPEAADHSPEKVEIVQGLDQMLDAIGIE
jgi:HAD superfamily hydrolase (TIGR01549 family)